MKRVWKKIATVSIAILIVFSVTAFAHDSNSIRSESVDEQKDANRASDTSGSIRPGVQRFTDEQKASVASILSHFNASSLTVEDAKAINNAFREAGIRRGPELAEAVKAAGFDGKAISALDPPPAPRAAGPNMSDPSK